MAKGPNGETRPADTVGCAVKVGRIATGENSDRPPLPERNDCALPSGRLSDSGNSDRKGK